MFVEEKAVGEEQEIQRGTLKLSDAMRRGIRMSAPLFGSNPYITYGPNGLSACAWGAAALGMGGDRPLAGSLHVSHPADAAFKERYGFGVMRASDDGRMTREEIADALEALGF